MEVGLVHKIDIDNEMQQAYLDYAMSVIVARALPDARDGLKPVHRRILYAMYDMGLRPDSAYKKSARIVGEVLGKYHPHGDMAVYDAMARMAQDFSMRYLLVDGQGNFGSVDGDPPAAMRYTEARLQAPATEMLVDIDKNTVDFDENFDGTLKEPSVLPSAIPNLLVNGATGIAVGMSTSIPPHNLGEVVDALKYLLENWEKSDDIALEDLMNFIQGPDFPTGGVIIQESEGDGLHAAYGSGRGKVTVQARAHLEEMERGRNRIIVTELPYMTNKASLIERIATLVRDERLEGIGDLRDESDRQGMRIVIELTRGTDPEKVLRELYKSTPMRSTFSMIMLALVDGEPRLLGLKQALRVYVEHRLEIVRRRSEHDLNKARQRAHILEGYRVALKNLDEVISLIRRSPDADTARQRLMKRFKLSEVQAQAILDLQLRRLASLERKKIEEEYKEVLALIKELESLLRSPKKMRQVVANELQAVKEAYGDRRRTQIVHLKEGEQKVSFLTATDLTPEKIVWVSVTADGLISNTEEDKLPRLSGSEAPLWLIQAHSRDTLFLVGENGEAAAIPLHAVPEAEKPSQGTPFYKISPLGANIPLAAVFSLPARADLPEDQFILTVSRQGMVKKSPMSELPGPSANTFTLARLNEGDRLGWTRFSDGQSELLLVTENGMAIRFKEEEVRPMGLVAAGVMGIKLQKTDALAGVEVIPPKKPAQLGEVFLVASDGTAKRVAINQFPTQGRYGQGVTAWKLPAKVKAVGMTIGKGTQRATLHLDKLAPKSIRLDDAPRLGRTARGQSIQDLKSNDRVVALTVPVGMVRPETAPEIAGPDGDGASGGAEPEAKRPTARRSRSTTTKAASKTTSNGKAASSRSSRSKSAKATAGAATKSSRSRGASRETGSPSSAAAKESAAPKSSRSRSTRSKSSGTAKTGGSAKTGRSSRSSKTTAASADQTASRTTKTGRSSRASKTSTSSAGKTPSRKSKGEAASAAESQSSTTKQSTTRRTKKSSGGRGAAKK